MSNIEEQKEQEKAFCLQCRKIVNVIYLSEQDEEGQVYDVPYCSECMNEINICCDCINWEPDRGDTPLGETYGKCPIKDKVHAFDLICPEYDGD